MIAAEAVVLVWLLDYFINAPGAPDESRTTRWNYDGTVREQVLVVHRPGAYVRIRMIDRKSRQQVRIVGGRRTCVNENLGSREATEAGERQEELGEVNRDGAAGGKALSGTPTFRVGLRSARSGR